jgi:hypothetical protein
MVHEIWSPDRSPGGSALANEKLSPGRRSFTTTSLSGAVLLMFVTRTLYSQFEPTSIVAGANRSSLMTLVAGSPVGIACPLQFQPAGRSTGRFSFESEAAAPL